MTTVPDGVGGSPRRMTFTNPLWVRAQEVEGRRRTGGTGALYFLGLIGATVYNVGHADGFGETVLGILSALVWPAVAVYRILAG